MSDRRDVPLQIFRNPNDLRIIIESQDSKVGYKIKRTNDESKIPLIASGFVFTDKDECISVLEAMFNAIYSRFSPRAKIYALKHGRTLNVGDIEKIINRLKEKDIIVTNGIL